MPTLDFKGKQHVYAHHLTVPWRPLVPHPAKSVGSGAIDDNLIIHGDNLHALKALLPRYGGRVRCIYIDPPYNTGNEGWVYNDNANGPLLKQWLKEQSPVDGEDMERHDKWLCMMWPRLHLLRELLTDDGVIFVSIDGNEIHHLRMLMAEIFDERNFVNMFVWVNNLKGRQISGCGAAGTHEYILVYAKDIDNLSKFENSIEFLKNTMPSTYRNQKYEIQKDKHGEYVTKNELHNTNPKFNEHTRPKLVFDIYYNPQTDEVLCEDLSVTHMHPGYLKVSPKPNRSGRGRFHAWRWSRKKVAAESHNLKFEVEPDRTTSIYTKVRKYDTTAVKDVITDISTTRGKQDLKEIFSKEIFDFPKPVDLIRVLVSASSSDDDAIVLDSFAGSGTTAQAVIELNKRDGGNRKFILVECEDYADSITAERVRRVISGVPEAKNAELRGGLGGSFTYCTLGEPVTSVGMLTGETLPTYSSLAAWLINTATGQSAGPTELRALDKHGLIHSDERRNYYLRYRPDIEWLRSNDAVLTETRAEELGEICRRQNKDAVVFAAAKYIPQGDLTGLRITFCQLPYAIRQTEAV